MASRREGERVGDFQIEWFQPVFAPVQVRLAHTSSGLSTAAISFDAYPQGKCALGGKKGMVHNPAEVQAARFARPATTSRRPIGLALRPAYSELRCEAALQGRCAGSYAGSASRAGPNFAEVQGCVHATRRAQSGLGSASRPAYSSIRCVQSSEFKLAKNTTQAGWENPISRSQRAPRLLPKQLTAAPEAARLNATRSHA